MESALTVMLTQAKFFVRRAPPLQIAQNAHQTFGLMMSLAPV